MTEEAGEEESVPFTEKPHGKKTPRVRGLLFRAGRPIIGAYKILSSGETICWTETTCWS